jgi:hypothetical protein
MPRSFMVRVAATVGVVVAVLLPVVVVGGYYLLRAGCGNEVLSQARSPDGLYEAVVFQRDCGAATGFSTQVSVIAHQLLQWRTPLVLVISHHTTARVFNTGILPAAHPLTQEAPHELRTCSSSHLRSHPKSARRSWTGGMKRQSGQRTTAMTIRKSVLNNCARGSRR